MSVTSDQLNNADTNSFLTALVANSALLVVEVTAFLILKRRLGRIYSPRTYLPPPDKRAAELPNSVWKWLPALIATPSQDIIHKNGLDAYMFLRFLRMLLKILVIFTVLTFLVIVPANYAGVTHQAEGINRITWSNLDSEIHYRRYAAHIVVVYVLTFIVLYMIRKEMLHFVHTRHQFLISKSHSRLPQARTVLITNCAEELADEHELRQFCSFVPGGIDRVWIFRDTKTLNDLHEEREQACKKLETAQSHILRQAAAAWRKKRKAHKAAYKAAKKAKDVEVTMEEHLEVPPASIELLDELVPVANRPTHRVGLMGVFGEKVDTVEWCSKEISRLNEDIKDKREHIAKGKFLGSVFVRCNLQMGAHLLAQTVAWHEPLIMYEKWMDANPKDIVWANLDDGALEMRGRHVLSWVLTIGLIIGWSFPVAAVGALSNATKLCQEYWWLARLCRAPKPIPSIISGILPPVLLAALFAVLPLILRALAWYECIPRYSLISLSVYRRFFVFLVIHGFLVATLSSGITDTIKDIINNPTAAVQQLSQKLPTASIFFLTYLVTQGLAGAGIALAQLFPIILHFIQKWFLGRTPRQAYTITFTMPAADFGVIFPRISLLAMIAFAYSVLNPLINVLALASFGMLYIAWRFLLTQVFDQPDESETGGLYFPMAINNLFAGLYVEQVCLACLFFLKATGTSDDAPNGAAIKGSSYAEAALMVVLLFITVFFQIFIQSSFGPITNYLPMSLATKDMAKKFAKRRGRHPATAGANANDEMDLFSRDNVSGLRKRIKKLDFKIDTKLDNLRAKVVDKLDLPKPSIESKEYRPPLATGVEQNPVKPIPANVEPSDETATEKFDAVPEVPLARTASTVSHHSRPSNDLPVIDPPAPALDDDDDIEEEEDPNVHAFDHPSTYKDQPWIWLPRDELGLCDLLVADLKASGVNASDIGATMDKHGVVEVTRNPPDEAWEGGHDT